VSVKIPEVGDKVWVQATVTGYGYFADGTIDVIEVYIQGVYRDGFPDLDAGTNDDGSLWTR
jgi:hypothetical protein